MQSITAGAHSSRQLGVAAAARSAPVPVNPCACMRVCGNTTAASQRQPSAPEHKSRCLEYRILTGRLVYGRYSGVMQHKTAQGAIAFESMGQQPGKHTFTTSKGFTTRADTTEAPAAAKKRCCSVSCAPCLAAVWGADPSTPPTPSTWSASDRRGWCAASDCCGCDGVCFCCCCCWCDCTCNVESALLWRSSAVLLTESTAGRCSGG